MRLAGIFAALLLSACGGGDPEPEATNPEPPQQTTPDPSLKCYIGNPVCNTQGKT